MLIPTRNKSKLPHTMAYPIGAEAISVALLGVPQFTDLEIWFSDYAGVFASDFREKRRRGQPYKILEARMSDPFLPYNKAGLYEKHWSLYVYAVPCELKSEVKRLLLAEGLLNVKQWLAMPRSETWLMGRKSCSIYWHEPSKTISVQADD